MMGAYLQIISASGKTSLQISSCAYCFIFPGILPVAYDAAHSGHCGFGGCCHMLTLSVVLCSTRMI